MKLIFLTVHAYIYVRIVIMDNMIYGVKNDDVNAR